LRGLIVSAAAGAFRPSDEASRALYGSPQWPLFIQVEVPVRAPLSASAGFRWLTRGGATLAIPPAVDDRRFDIELRVASFRAGGLAALAHRRGRLFVGLGAEYARVSECWPSADLAQVSRGWGVIVQAGADAPIWGRLALRGLVEYSGLRAGEDPETGEKVPLGGLTLAAGVAFRFGE
jgi:hypothetical protein